MLLKWQNVPLTRQQQYVFGTVAIVEKGSYSRKAFYLPFILSSHLYYCGTYRQVPTLSTHNSFFKRAISAVYFSYCSPRALKYTSWSAVWAYDWAPSTWLVFAPRTAGLQLPELLRVVLAFEANGWRSMWWMAFMRAEYRWLKDRQLAWWKREDWARYITAPSPFPSIHFYIHFFISLFSYTSVWLVLHAPVSSPVQLAVTGR